MDSGIITLKSTSQQHGGSGTGRAAKKSNAEICWTAEKELVLTYIILVYEIKLKNGSF